MQREYSTVKKSNFRESQSLMGTTNKYHSRMNSIAQSRNGLPSIGRDNNTL
jgi:hypothetical protein